MANPNPKNRFTSETGKAASRLSKSTARYLKRADKDLAKLKLAGLTESNVMDLLKGALTQPVIVGLIGYATVNQMPTLFSAIGKSSSSSSTTGTAGSSGTSTVLNVTGNPIIDFFSGLVSSLLTGGKATTTGNVGGTGIGGTGIGYNIVSDIEIAALKGALLLYIASGGNLAGVLTAAGGPLSDALKALVPAAEAA